MAVAVVTLGLIFPHTGTQLAEWVDAWETDATQGVDGGMLANYRDMADRHPWYFSPVPETVHSGPAAATPAPAKPAPLPSGDGVERWRELVAAHFNPGDVDRALCLIGHESAGDPNAVNPSSGAAGLFQIMPFWWEKYGGSRFDPADNTALAARILAEQGWTAWSPYNRGLCH